MYAHYSAETFCHPLWGHIRYFPAPSIVEITWLGMDTTTMTQPGHQQLEEEEEEEEVQLED